MILTNIGFVLAVVLAAVLLAVIVDACRSKGKKDTMSFRESMDLVGLPIVTFKVDGKKFNFLLDTGANNSAIDKNALPEIKHEKTNFQTNMFGVEGKKVTCKFVSIGVEYKERVFKEDFLVNDLSRAFAAMKTDFGVTLHGIIGSSFLEKYKYVIDFKEMIAYSEV